MKTFFVLFSIVFTIRGFSQDAHPTLTKGYLDGIDVIVSAKPYKKDDKGHFVFQTIEVYKGILNSPGIFVVYQLDLQFDSGSVYLMYLRNPDSVGNGESSGLNCVRTVDLPKASKEIKFIADNIVCVNKLQIVENAICHRVYNPVCGCDGVTYGNCCEARQHGIVRYTQGKCLTDK